MIAVVNLEQKESVDQLPTARKGSQLNIKQTAVTLLVWLTIVVILLSVVNTLTIQFESSIVIPLPLIQIKWGGGDDDYEGVTDDGSSN